MEIKKKKGTFNTYQLEISWSQLQTFKQALEQDHANVVGDETLQEISYYLSNLPGPGEDEEDLKAQANAEDVVAGDGSLLPVVKPPGHESGGAPGAAKPGLPPAGKPGAARHAPSAADKLLGRPGTPAPGAASQKAGSRQPMPELGMEEETAPGPQDATDKRVPRPPTE